LCHTTSGVHNPTKSLEKKKKTQAAVKIQQPTVLLMREKVVLEASARRAVITAHRWATCERQL
jgi:hypothetical protein